MKFNDTFVDLTKIILYICSAILISWLVACSIELIFETCAPQYEYVHVKTAVKSKHCEYESVGKCGEFEVKHYVLYTNGDLRDESLKTYMSLKEGDSVTYTCKTIKTK